jgi:hypothetical protein
MLVRTLLMFFVGGAILFGGDLWQESGKRKTAIWQGLLMLVATMCFMISGSFLGLLAYIAALGPILRDTSPDGWGELAYMPGFILGAWCSSMGIQVLGNAARRICGKPAAKLSFIRLPVRKRRKKAAARQSGEH